jgi:hypothetical protein
VSQLTYIVSGNMPMFRFISVLETLFFNFVRLTVNR